MTTLNKANIKKHCRTCLIKLNVEEINDDMTNETKDICIRIAENTELQSFINNYIAEERFFTSLFIDRLPQHVCVECFNTIQQFEKFLTQAKSSAEALHKLLSDAIKNCQGGELHEENKDIDRLLLKDSLLEEESVLFNNTLQSDEVVIKADPFTENTHLNHSDENYTESSDESEDENDWESASTSSSCSEKYYKTRRSCQTKSVKKNVDDKEAVESKDPIAEDNDSTTPQKKKRRSKQEMEDYRRQQSEKTPFKYKRRPKGTKNKFRCTQCDHRFASQFTLDVHIRKVHEGNPRPYLCEHCPKTYVALTGLTSHIQVEHSAVRRTFNCEECNRSYTCLMGLQNHKRIKHSDPDKLKQFVCEKCGDTFWKRSLLLYHRRAKHPTEAEKAKKTELFECDVCHTILHSKHTLKYHKQQQHSGELKYKCDVCGQRLAQKSSVEYHRALHSAEKVPCKDCDKLFVRTYDLMKHVRVVHMKLKPYKCSYCPESFASNKTMKHHQYTHTGEKPYVCKFCNKSYRQPTCLKNHLKTHENNG